MRTLDKEAVKVRWTVVNSFGSAASRSVPSLLYWRCVFFSALVRVAVPRSFKASPTVAWEAWLFGGL